MDYRIEQLRFQLREDPTSRQFYQLGELLRRAGELEESASILRAGLEHHPRYLAAWVALGRTLYDLNRFDQAESSFARALALDPQNAVAAQMVGRAAARRGEWARAVNGFNLALALVPGDESIESELAEARSHLAETMTPGETIPAEGGLPPPLPDHEATPIPPPERPLSPILVRSTEVTVLSAEDPFAAGPRGDTGVWLTGEDVFAAGEMPPPEEPPEAPRVEAAMAPPQEPVVEAATEALATAEDAVPTAEDASPPAVAREALAAEPPAGPPAIPPPLPTVGEAPEEPEEPEDREIPLPTVTLARLALDQGDIELAERTLSGVLEREPGSEAARTLLDEVRRIRSEGELEAGRRGLAAAKVGALRGWLETVRLAAGRGER